MSMHLDIKSNRQSSENPARMYAYLVARALAIVCLAIVEPSFVVVELEQAGCAIVCFAGVPEPMGSAEPDSGFRQPHTLRAQASYACLPNCKRCLAPVVWIRAARSRCLVDVRMRCRYHVWLATPPVLEPRPPGNPGSGRWRPCTTGAKASH